MTSYVEREDVGSGGGLLRVDPPGRLNALSHLLIDAILERLDELSRDRSCRVVILTGAGRGFCAGADIKGEPGVPSVVSLGPVATFESQKRYSEITLKMRSIPQPIIAAVNGPATGGGL